MKPEFISEPMKIGKTLWRIIAYWQTYIIGRSFVTEYEWFEFYGDPEDTMVVEGKTVPYGRWQPARKWPRYDSNDTYNGLPKSLVKLWEKNLATLRKLEGRIAQVGE